MLKALIRKSKTIREQLGSVAPVLERRLEDQLSSGFARKDAGTLAKAIEDERIDPMKEAAAREELEATRIRDQDLVTEIASLGGLLKKSRDWLKLEEVDLRGKRSPAVWSCSVSRLSCPARRKGRSSFPS